MSFPTTAHDCYDAEESPVESSCGLSKGRRGLRPETSPSHFVLSLHLDS